MSPGKINAGQTCETNAFSLIYDITDCGCGPRSCVFGNCCQTPSCLCSSFSFPKSQPHGTEKGSLGLGRALKGPRVMEEVRADRLRFKYRFWHLLTVQAWISDSGLRVLTCNLTEFRGQFWAAAACCSSWCSHHQSTEAHLGPMGKAERKGKTRPKGRAQLLRV